MTDYTVKFIDMKIELKVNQIKCTKLNKCFFLGGGREAIIPDVLFAQSMKFFESQANVV